MQPYSVLSGGAVATQSSQRISIVKQVLVEASIGLASNPVSSTAFSDPRSKGPIHKVQVPGGDDEQRRVYLSYCAPRVVGIHY
mmetsp:Transcript_87747/g.165487  ORF Transcript_87747/g.165487 Transcript_87747/m.165487 type:complete len:83 (-) Transcript_87747:56-304(-)